MHRNTSVCLTGPPLVPEPQSPKTSKQRFNVKKGKFLKLNLINKYKSV